ncbi:LamG-like jellyroll fold domain-containing protein [uncultured Muribaculum sp.]|uniref:LamG-like jellyroll fold domain-containing protein n=2 Tax=uncultured Muribaculum sp. TaxID=1918613 RepID=UPI0025B22DAB|nr:LamG-like jellyroll fold domain-containing protein [uncultured Muribaculum sp.]
MKTSMLKPLFAAVMGMVAPALSVIASETSDPVPVADRSLFFDIFAGGQAKPIEWGLDTAWPDEANMRRGVRFLGSDIIDVARVSFQPWAQITEKGVLPDVLRNNLAERMRLVGLIGHKVNIALNLDAGDPTLHDVYDNKPAEWAKLIDATAAAVQEMGYTVVSAAPFNEPDYQWNGLSQFIFSLINSTLKNADNYPRFQSIRLSGGNTLNCDEALPWYNALKSNLDEGNTHQLAGSFDNYANFFQTVRADGKHATADELHNVMEAMVGVEYGMQTGIWWGHADLVRGEFCKASGGERLAYAENRKAWSSAAVYRAPSGKIQGFVGSSERQAEPCTYRFVSRTADVYFDGYGPTREFVTDIPGDYDTYQGPNQTSAEAVFHITSGADIQPVVNGNYTIMNGAWLKVLGFSNGSSDDLARLFVNTPSKTGWQQWKVVPVPHTIGGDYSGYLITNIASEKMMDVYNWSLEAGGEIIQWPYGGGHNQQWYLEYDSDNWFRIRSRYSGLYLTAGTDGQVRQQEFIADKIQLWRFLPTDAECETDKPAVPSGLAAQPLQGAVSLTWTAPADADVAGYAVLRAERGKEDFNTIARNIKECRFIDNTVRAGVVYDYKVFASDWSLNRSDASSAVSSSSANGNGIKASFGFDANLDDATENEFVLCPFATPVFLEGGNGTKALGFDGAQWLQLPYTLCQMPEMTVMARVRNDGGEGVQHIFDFGMADDASLYLTPAENGNMRLVMKHGDDVAMVDAPAAIQGKWMHVAAVVGKGIMTLYVDGKNIGSAGADINADNFMLSYIGRGQNLDGSLFKGAMSDFRIYNYPLSDEQIAQAAAGQSSGIDNIELPVADAVSVEYYSLGGVRLSAPVKGALNIVKTCFADGTVRVDKTYIK